MFGLTPLGTLHTAISLVALAAGLSALLRDGQIVAGTRSGRIYAIATLLTCLTGFGIFNHGGFGKPHVLGIVTLVVLALAWAAGRRGLFGAAAAYVEVVAFSATFFFHLIPGVTETTIRLPVGKPLFSGPDDPGLQPIAAGLFLLFLIGATWQVLRLRRARRGAPQPA
ncbi:hypothetical protein G8A07_22390 [Roseateles sp. DAIF2]|uniref:hypothetical protein n=1 Tax=Roseateles sp. DAIF2 TaxID=2714952 RepID=UPI0018A27ABC|nr:hypothetical protein [Roseateles sp. DAIF2]QPF75397.1 hypothetical protein G8A07_22390 [Roseateles sp. DAIF2]